MVLYVPGARGTGWDSYHNDWDVGPVTTTPNGQLTLSSGTSGAFSSTSQLIPALPFDVGYIILDWTQGNATGRDNRSEGEIRIDRAGGASWETDPLVPSIPLAGANSTNNLQGRMDLPLFIPAGASLGIRSTAAAATASTYRFGMTVFARAALPPGWKCGQKAVAIGVNAYPDLGGTNVATGGSWVDVGAPLEHDTFGMILMCGGIDGITMNGTQALMAQMGAGSQPLWHPHINALTGTNEIVTPMHRSINCGVVVPAGTQMQVRVNNLAGDTLRYTIMGVV